MTTICRAAIVLAAICALAFASDESKEALYRGLSRVTAGDNSKAIEHFTRAIELDPKYAEAYYRRGWSYEMLGDHETAIADHTRAIELDPNYALAYAGRGASYYELGDYKNATEDAKKACDLGDCRSLRFMEEKEQNPRWTTIELFFIACVLLAIAGVIRNRIRARPHQPTHKTKLQ
ncbi:hypothetical protein FACS1894103_2360 [Campylobacterota bacterium]|nr:hypothetical protein FACS1894103_2360 [Campylobacterota bacterium]